MAKAARRRVALDLGLSLLDAWDTNERINQYLLGALDAKLWRAAPPGSGSKGRTIAAIVSHIHNVRHMALVVSGKGLPIRVPAKLDRHDVTPVKARAALAASAQAMRRLLEAALAAGGRVRDFAPGVVLFFTSAVSHEAHHRGQICLLAREAGAPLPFETTYGMWDWKKRFREI